MTEAENFTQSQWETLLGVFEVRPCWFDRRYYLVTYTHKVLWFQDDTYPAVVDDFGNLVEVRFEDFS